MFLRHPGRSAKSSKSRRHHSCAPLASEPLEERRMMAVLVDDDYPIPATVTNVAMADATRQESDVAYFHPDRVLVDFWGLVNVDASGAHSALNVNNWRLIKDGVDLSHLIIGVQVRERINNHTDLAVHLSDRLDTGNYRIIALDSIYDEYGRPINGDSDDKDPAPGGDADVTFVVADALAEAETEKLAWSPAQSLPVVAADAQGNYVVVWTGSSPGGTSEDLTEASGKIFAQRYNAGGYKVGSVIVVATDLPAGTSRIYSNLKVAMAADGSFAVSWDTQSRGLGVEIVNLNTRPLARRFDANGLALGEAFEVGDQGSSVQSIALSDSGELIVGYIDYPVWIHPPVDWDPIIRPMEVLNNQTVIPAHAIVDIPNIPWLPLLTTSKLFLQRYSSSGVTIGSAIEVGNGANLRLVVNSQDIVTAVWLDRGHDGVDRLTVQQFFPQGGSSGAKVLLDSLPGLATAAEIAVDAAGTITIAWDQESEGVHQIYLHRFSANLQPQGQPVLVSQSTSTFAARISIAMHRDGSFFVVWDVSGGINFLRPNYYGLVIEPTQVDAELGSLRGRGFDATGAARSDEFAFGSTDATAGDLSSVVTEPGKLVVAWLDGGGYYPVEGDTFNHYRIREVNIREFMVPIDLVVDLNGNPPGLNIKRDFVPGGSPALLSDPGELEIHAESETIASAKITIEGYQSGDTLLTYSTNANIHWSFNNGVLTLSGVDTVARYRRLLNDIWFSTTANRAAGSKINIRVVVNDGAGDSDPAYSYISIHVPGRSSIAGRHLFYNNSSFDGSNPAANAADDGAIATDKTALLPGQTATKNNYTNYTRGINGIMVDLAGSHGEVTVDDFIFRVGNSNDPSGWAYAPAPRAIVVRPGAGVGGADRVEITWADGAIQDTWLQVIVLDNGDTGLAAPDTFYFGNRVGDSGNESARAQPQSNEALQLINRLRSAGTNGVDASISDPLDFDRNGRINTQDLLAVFNAIRAQKDALNMIHAPGGQAGLEGAIITGGVTIVITQPPIYTATVLELQTAIAATLADWTDDDATEARLPLVSVSPLMEAPEV